MYSDVFGANRGLELPHYKVPPVLAKTQAFWVFLHAKEQCNATTEIHVFHGNS